MKNPYAKFQTNKAEEQTGVALDFGDFRVIVRRAGGANKLYQKVAAEILAPYQRALKLNAVDEDTATRLQREIYARAVVADWLVKDQSDDGSYFSGVYDPASGEVVEVDEEVVARVFEYAPEIFEEVRAFASDAMQFRTDDDEAAVGNS